METAKIGHYNRLRHAEYAIPKYIPPFEGISHLKFNNITGYTYQTSFY